MLGAEHAAALAAKRDPATIEGTDIYFKDIVNVDAALLVLALLSA